MTSRLLVIFLATRRTFVRGRAKENAFNIQIEQILKLVELQAFLVNFLPTRRTCVRLRGKEINFCIQT